MLIKQKNTQFPINLNHVSFTKIKNKELRNKPRRINKFFRSLNRWKRFSAKERIKYAENKIARNIELKERIIRKNIELVYNVEEN